jgi:hypothetical protein
MVCVCVCVWVCVCVCVCVFQCVCLRSSMLFHCDCIYMWVIAVFRTRVLSHLVSLIWLGRTPNLAGQNAESDTHPN